MHPSPIILNLESATAVCSVAIQSNEKLLSVVESKEGNKHSEWMTIYVQQCLQQANIEINQLDAVAVSMGPGSYTGLRVGYSLAKAIAYQLDIPLIEINPLRALAFSIERLHSNDLIISMVDARRMEVYMQTYDYTYRPLDDVKAIVLTDWDCDFLNNYQQIHIVGNGANKCSEAGWPKAIMDKITIHPTLNSAEWMRFESLEKWKNNEFADVAYCVPFYLKKPNITKSSKPLF